MPSVLIVDDEPNVRAVVRDLLELSGYEVREAADGTSALEALEDELPDCMVLDIMMPGLSGIDVLTTLRERPELGTLPVLLLSAAGDDQTTWDGWRAGANCYLTKPFDPDRLTAWLNHLAKERARTEATPSSVDQARSSVDQARIIPGGGVSRENVLDQRASGGLIDVAE